MKKLFSLALLSLFALPAAAFADLKIGTVDMGRAFKEYNKTKDAEAKVRAAGDSAKKELDDRMDAYKKSLDELNTLTKQLDATALSAEAKAQKAKDRDDKIASIKGMEREITEFRQTRDKQLQEQMVRMREGIVKEISDIVMERVKTQNYDLVLDRSGVSLNSVPLVMYARDSYDFTTDIIATLNKPGRVTAEPKVEAPTAPARAAATPKRP